MVKTTYNFHGPRVQSIVTFLLADDRFLCSDIQQRKGPFNAPIIIKALALFLYDTAYSFGRLHDTKSLFATLTKNIVVYTCVQIRVAISDWQGGIRKPGRNDQHGCK